MRVRDTDELTLDDLKETLPIFISNITVNDWQISSDAKSSHQLIAFSSKGVKLIGSEWEKATKLSECFTPEYMRLSAAMAISGAAVSYDMGSYESRLDMVLDLLNLLGIGMGDEMVSDQCNCQTKVQSTSGKIKQVCERCHFHLPGGGLPCKMDGCYSHLLGVRKRPFIWKSPPPRVKPSTISLSTAFITANVVFKSMFMYMKPALTHQHCFCFFAVRSTLPG